MIAYKVVNQSYVDQKYYSAVYGQTEYVIGKAVKAPTIIYKELVLPTRLFVFETIDMAFEYANGSYSKKVFECEIKGGVDFYPTSYFNDIPYYWYLVNQVLTAKKNLYKSNIYDKLSIDIGWGSILATSVKLIKEVKE